MQYKEMTFTKIEVETSQLLLKRCSVVYDDSWCTEFKIFFYRCMTFETGVCNNMQYPFIT